MTKREPDDNRVSGGRRPVAPVTKGLKPAGNGPRTAAPPTPPSGAGPVARAEDATAQTNPTSKES